jgi:hypothetical protein
VTLPAKAVLVVGLSGFKGVNGAGTDPFTPIIRLQLDFPDLDTVRFAMRVNYRFAKAELNRAATCRASYLAIEALTLSKLLMSHAGLSLYSASASGITSVSHKKRKRFQVSPSSSLNLENPM